MIDAAYVLKFYRRVQTTPNPESEIGSFLTDVVKFPNSPALLGTVEMAERAGGASLFAVMHEFIENQGDAWAFTAAYLDRALDEQRVVAAEATESGEAHLAFANRMHQIGIRVGELHRALASRGRGASTLPRSRSRQPTCANGTRNKAGAETIPSTSWLGALIACEKTAAASVHELLAKRGRALERIHFASAGSNHGR